MSKRISELDAVTEVGSADLLEVSVSQGSGIYASRKVAVSDFVGGGGFPILPVTSGGTGAPTAAGARTNLGLAIGTNVQAADATLTSIATLGTAADKLAYTTGVDTWAETALTAFGRSLIADADAPSCRSTIGLVIGTNVQAYDANLTAWAGKTADTDATLAANSDARIATQKAVKTYADALIAANDAMVYKGATDCSASPNYPAADAGWTYRVSVAGKIGGSSGIVVEAGDMFICLTDGSASGNQATVGSHWNIIQTNIDGAVVGPSSATDGAVALFNGTTGKLIKNGGAGTLTSLALGGATLGSHDLATAGAATFGGLVGIGMTPVNPLDIYKSINGNSTAKITNDNAGIAAGAQLTASNGTHGTTLGQLGENYTTSSAFVQKYGFLYADMGLSIIAAGGPILFAANGATEKGRFGTDGSFLVGTATNGGYTGNAKLAVQASSGQGITSYVTSSGQNAFVARVDNTGSNFITFTYSTSDVGRVSSDSANLYYDSVSSTVMRSGGSGGVQLDPGGTSWGTHSDYRMKTIANDFDNAGSIIDAVPVYNARYNDRKQFRPMFLAHELQDGGAGFAVVGAKDAVDADGNPIYQTIQSTDPLVGVLWAALRETRVRLAALEAARK